MSRMNNILAGVYRQYTCLVLNRCRGPVCIQNTSLHSSACMKTDTGTIPDTLNTSTDTAEPTAPKQKFRTQITLNPDYLPGGEYFPTDKIYEHMVDGVRFDELPRIHIKATMQNTLASAHLSDKLGTCLSTQTGGKLGFKNTKKKTNVCGQTVGLAVGMDLMKKGYKNACIIVRGQGAGRLPAIKGVQLAGVNIVSITDRTFPNVSTRARKARRL